jgi:hypothetical protein
MVFLKIWLEKINLFKIYWKILICIFILGLIYLVSTKLIFTEEVNIGSFFRNLIFIGVIFLIPILVLPKLDIHNGSITAHKNQHNLTSVKIFFIVFSLSICYLLITPMKSILFVILFTVLFFIVFIQIINLNVSSLIIIFELIITFLSIIFSVTLKYPLYFGATDILLHLDYSKLISILGHTLPLDYSSAYTFYPVSHLITVISSELLNINIESAFYLTTGLIFSFSILFLYALFRFISMQKIALLACLLYCSSGSLIFYGLYMTPRSMAFILYLLLLFLIIKMNFEDTNKYKYFILSLLICIALIFVHHASDFQILPIFLLFFISLAFFNILKGTHKKLIYIPILIFGVLVIVHWFYIAQTFSISLMEYAKRVLESDATGLSSTYFQQSLVIQKSLFEENISFIVSYGPIIILFLFVFLGIGIICKQNANKKLLVFGVLAFLSTPFWAPSMIGQLNIFVGFVFDRIILFSSPFIMLIFGYGLYNSITYSNQRKNVYIISIIAILFLIYTFFSLGTIPFYDYEIQISPGIGNFDRFSFNENDFGFMNFADHFISSGSTIISDYFVARYYEGKSYFMGIDNYDIKYYQHEDLGNLKNLESEKGYIIFREEYLEKEEIMTNNTSFPPFEKNQALEDNSNIFEKIYSSNSNMIYLTQ